jgi:hypothetical protein
MECIAWYDLVTIRSNSKAKTVIAQIRNVEGLENFDHLAEFDL